jgi:hypothetical protein
MKALILSSLSVLGMTMGASCKGQEARPSTQANQNCAGESVLAVYQNQVAVVTMTQKDTYCLIADSAAIANHSYKLDNYLVPATALSPQYQVEGLRVLFSGRKKSCYGLTTLPTLRNSFGYKLEIDAIQAQDK